MHSYLVCSFDPSQSKAKALELCTSLEIAPIDITTVERNPESTKTKQSLGIEEVKELQKRIFLKPVQSRQKAIILINADLLTVEAQNAMLKTLEEPPDHTILILTTPSVEAVLPTIRSRCKIILLESGQLISFEEGQDIRRALQDLKKDPVKAALLLAEKKGKNKEDALLWLEKFQLVLRKEMLQATTATEQQAAAHLLKEVTKAYSTLKKVNVQPRFILEQLFLSSVHA